MQGMVLASIAVVSARQPHCQRYRAYLVYITARTVGSSVHGDITRLSFPRGGLIGYCLGGRPEMFP